MKNVLEVEKLESNVVVANYATTATDGKIIGINSIWTIKKTVIPINLQIKTINVLLSKLVAPRNACFLGHFF